MGNFLKINRVFAVFWIFGVGAGGALLSGCRPSKDSSGGNLATFLDDGNPAYSADPVDYDAEMHQVVFSSVHAWLISNYRLGRGYEGQLAETWHTSKDFKEWTFQFRPRMTFENGDPITPRDLVDSWLRLVRVLKGRGSAAAGLANLVGYEDFPQRTATIAGMTYDSHSITLRFNRSMPKLFDVITFGLYALVHPSCYDHRTGAWLDPKRTVASGPYRIKEWDAHHVLLALRSEYPVALRHPRAFDQIDLRWETGSKKDADLIFASSRATLAAQGYEYHGGAANGIGYLRCQSWKDRSSPLSDRSLRRRLRLAFYEELEKGPLHPEKSFFPLRFKGVHELSDALSPKDASGRLPSNALIRYADTPPLGSVGDALKVATERLGLRFSLVDVPFETQRAEHHSTTNSYKDDLSYFTTGIDLDDPDSDIRFMIRAKEGISLPDPTGRLVAAIRHSPIDMQEVNEILWDDALIWPVIHDSSGIWARPEFDFSLVNILLPPTPLYLVGRKG